MSDAGSGGSGGGSQDEGKLKIAEDIDAGHSVELPDELHETAAFVEPVPRLII